MQKKSLKTEIEELCGKQNCGRIVENVKICCDLCDKWIHQKCTELETIKFTFLR